MATVQDNPKTAEQPVDAQAQNEQAPQKKSGRKPFVFLIVGVLLVVAIIYGMRFFAYASSHATTDDAYVSSDIVQLAPEISGTVVKVLVSDNQHVKKGELIAVIDDATYASAVQQAQANLDLAMAQTGGAKASTSLTEQTGGAQVQQALGGVEQSQGAIASARADVSRAAAAEATAKANVQGAISGVASAKSALASAIATRERAKAAITGAEATIRNAQAAVSAAQAALVSAQASATRANRDVERAQQLFAQGAISAQQADAARATADVANAQVNAAQQNVSAAQAAVQQRQADLGSARAALNAAESGVAQANAQISAAQSQVQAARNVVAQNQAQRLSAERAITTAQGKIGQAQGQLQQARTVTTQVEVSRNLESQADARVEQAKAALQQAQINLQRTRIYAPVDGTVTKKSVFVGSLVQPGTPLMALVPSEALWVDANYKETELAHVRVGQKAEVTVDAIPGHAFVGTVQSISAGTGATFALLPPENATGNFTKVVQRIPVRITFDPGQRDLDRLRVGMSVVAAIRTK
jgi:membrane fusion protein (multidrug efflux system)